MVHDTPDWGMAGSSLKPPALPFWLEPDIHQSQDVVNFESFPFFVCQGRFHHVGQMLNRFFFVGREDNLNLVQDAQGLSPGVRRHQ